MEKKKTYKKIIMVLTIILLISIWHSYSIIHNKQQNQVMSVGVDIVMEDIKNLEDINYLDGENNKIESGDTGGISLAEFHGYKLVENYKQIIIDKNIFGLIDKIEVQEENSENMLENEPVREREKYNTYNTEKEPVIKNPFYIQAVSINEYDKMAIIVNQDNFNSYIIKRGMIVDGYLVKSVAYDEIVMEKNGQEIYVMFQN